MPGKEMLRVVPDGPLRCVDDALIAGQQKHDDWDSSANKDVYIGAILRHLGKWLAGERLDQQDGHHHLSAVIVRCFQLLDKES